mmetsp:Transcript_21465/g.53929  ORF Transcript_21465/g.53929 Transcript_21465/m.53929 type:complete len:223 (+) Transcript_21465:106-774(+)
MFPNVASMALPISPPTPHRGGGPSPPGSPPACIMHSRMYAMTPARASSTLRSDPPPAPHSHTASVSFATRDHLRWYLRPTASRRTNVESHSYVSRAMPSVSSACTTTSSSVVVSPAYLAPSAVTNSVAAIAMRSRYGNDATIGSGTSNPASRVWCACTYRHSHSAIPPATSTVSPPAAPRTANTQLRRFGKIVNSVSQCIISLHTASENSPHRSAVAGRLAK